MTGLPGNLESASHFVPSAAGSDNSTRLSPTGATRSSENIDDDGASHLAAVAQAEYASRRRRNGMFHKSLFAEPAWDMLLDLYIQRHHGRAVSIHSLCIAAAVPQTTALRWIGKLETGGLVHRHPCRQDNRVVHITLSEQALALMEQYLRGQPGGRAAAHGGMPPLG